MPGRNFLFFRYSPTGSENGCDRKRPVCDRNGEAVLGFADISYQRGVKDRQGEGRLRCCG